MKNWTHPKNKYLAITKQLLNSNILYRILGQLTFHKIIWNATWWILWFRSVQSQTRRLDRTMPRRVTATFQRDWQIGARLDKRYLDSSNLVKNCCGCSEADSALFLWTKCAHVHMYMGRMKLKINSVNSYFTYLIIVKHRLFVFIVRLTEEHHYWQTLVYNNKYSQTRTACFTLKPKSISEILNLAKGWNHICDVTWQAPRQAVALGVLQVCVVPEELVHAAAESEEDQEVEHQKLEDVQGHPAEGNLEVMKL